MRLRSGGGKSNAERAYENGEARPSVSARVVTVRDKSSASNVLPYPDPEDCDGLVADEPNYRRCGDRNEMTHRLWMQ